MGREGRSGPRERLSPAKISPTFTGSRMSAAPDPDLRTLGLAHPILMSIIAIPRGSIARAAATVASGEGGRLRTPSLKRRISV